MRLVIFGTGGAYRENKGRIDKADEIVAFLDNDKNKQNKYLDDIPIYSPEKINDIYYEKVILMSDFAPEMRKQLLELGCEKASCEHYREYFAEKSNSIKEVEFDRDQKSCLIITSRLGYHGGAMVAVYAAQELMRRGYSAVIAAVGGDARFVEEFQKKGIVFVLDRNLPYLKWEKIDWIMKFQKIIVNTYPMVLCALEISKYRRVSLWLHESKNIYPSMRYWEDIIKDGVHNDNLKIYAVSDNAKRNFLDCVTKVSIEILPYGIPDTGIQVNRKKDILRFAVIGSIHPIKRQDFFLQTVKEIYKRDIPIEFMIIGKAEDPVYAKEVCKMAKTMEHVQMIGELQRDEMDKIYQDIDIVVVPSLYEALSTVVTEAMMNGIVCIASDSTGNSKYIIDRENGLTFRNGDGDDLRDKIEWCIAHRDKLSEIGKKARKMYEDNFMIQKMGDRLERLP